MGVYNVLIVWKRSVAGLVVSRVPLYVLFKFEVEC